MQQELQRAQRELGKLDPPPYFMSYAVHDQSMDVVVGSQGGLVNSTHGRTRSADVIVRVGSPALDNTHGDNRRSGISSGTIPLADDADAISHVLWQLTYSEYRRAAQAYLRVKTATEVNAKEEDTSPDFSQEVPQSHTDYHELAPAQDQQVLERMVRRYSAWLAKYSYVYRSIVTVIVHRVRWHFVSTEGTRVVTPSAMVRLTIEAETQADDGMELLRVETFQAETADHLPGEAEIAARVDKMAADLKALRSAPLAEPYDGPALLSGRAVAVFFHEVLGHRLEGHRQRGEKEGQTFTKKLNEMVLPEFLSVIDDPTQRAWKGVDLAGWYEYDDEAVPARRVEVIQNGVLKSFLMSRMPIKDFAKSNGHGRAQAGFLPAGRQANLIVTSSRAVKDAELRQKLIEEVKRQGKPYGLYFEDIEGGFTLTPRALPQAFLVLPILVWRVYPDGRPDELTRGVDIVGTPLAAISRILLTGEKTEVFNGVCGAESGSVPVSATAPAMLFSDIEVQKSSHSLNRPPILPPPGFEGAESKDAAKIGGPQ
jgi:predicted Zn-dependent protease